MGSRKGHIGEYVASASSLKAEIFGSLAGN